jgi:hypothetical protein
MSSKNLKTKNRKFSKTKNRKFSKTKKTKRLSRKKGIKSRKRSLKKLRFSERVVGKLQNVEDYMPKYKQPESKPYRPRVPFRPERQVIRNDLEARSVRRSVRPVPPTRSSSLKDPEETSMDSDMSMDYSDEPEYPVLTQEQQQQMYKDLPKDNPCLREKKSSVIKSLIGTLRSDNFINMMTSSYGYKFFEPMEFYKRLKGFRKLEHKAWKKITPRWAKNTDQTIEFLTYLEEKRKHAIKDIWKTPINSEMTKSDRINLFDKLGNLFYEYFNDKFGTERFNRILKSVLKKRPKVVLCMLKAILQNKNRQGSPMVVDDKGENVVIVPDPTEPPKPQIVRIKLNSDVSEKDIESIIKKGTITEKELEELKKLGTVLVMFGSKKSKKSKRKFSKRKRSKRKRSKRKRSKRTRRFSIRSKSKRKSKSKRTGKNPS